MPLLELAIMKAPKMFQKTERSKFLKVLQELENSTCTMGRNGTDFWYFAYKQYMNDLGFGAELWDILQNNKQIHVTFLQQFGQNLESFLLANNKYFCDILFDNNKTMVAFRMFMQMKNMPIYSSQFIVKCAMQIRF
ncbi:unnamed protein product [Thelazia callipaeda]|uniref:Uncharacterized protein n=1 Tax=Thelazia callipaeda TaxID=103827 RepID=A0A0N5CT10_THECL|nr:unnamed protein product [Thelazia callipaeda]